MSFSITLHLIIFLVTPRTPGFQMGAEYPNQEFITASIFTHQTIFPTQPSASFIDCIIHLLHLVGKNLICNNDGKRQSLGLPNHLPIQNSTQQGSSSTGRGSLFIPGHSSVLQLPTSAYRKSGATFLQGSKLTEVHVYSQLTPRKGQ